MALRKSIPAIAVGLTLVVLSCAAPAAFATQGYVVLQRSDNSTARLILTPTALRYDFYAPVQSGGKLRAKRPKPLLGIVIRYRDARLLLLDPVRRTYQVLALMGAITSYDSEMKAFSHAQPSDGLPSSPGTTKPDTKMKPLSQPSARLRRLAMTVRLGPVRARAYLLTQGAVRERIWYSATLPAPPSRVASLLAQALGSSAAGPLGRVLRAHAAQLPLRIDERSGRRWHTVLRTLSIKRQAIAASMFAPPRRYRKTALLQTTSAKPTASMASVPARPIRCGGLILLGIASGCTSISADLGGTAGPVMAHPAIYAWYWGSGWKNHLDYIAAINHGLENMVGDQFADPSSVDFWGPLSQYGVYQGKFLGYSIENSDPAASVGDWNVFDVIWFVFSHRWGTNAPHYWWRFDDQDPMFAIFVDGSKVESGDWNGYHAFAPTEAVFLSFLMHPAMPFFIIKTPALDSLSNDHESAAWDQAVDTATEYASHEFVETATDPYPFTSWADPLKEPIWEDGELADICQQGTTAPYAMNVRVAPYGTAFEPYWSNDAGACVPDTQPDVQVVYPQNGATYNWDSSVPFAVKTNDMFDDGPEPCVPVTPGQPCSGNEPQPGCPYGASKRCGQVLWTDGNNGPVLSDQSAFGTSTLTPGTHQIYVKVTDSQNGERTEGPITIHIVARPPVVDIDAPADGSSVAADHVNNFRGVALDPSQGDLGPSAVWSVDGSQIGTGAALLRYDITTQGSHLVTLSATNGAGVTASASIHVTVGPPTGLPSVAIVQPDDGSSFSAGTPITFTADAEAAGNATITNYAWSDDVDGPLPGNTDSITTTLSGSNCQIATHDVTVTATDSLGHTATDTITVKVGDIC